MKQVKGKMILSTAGLVILLFLISVPVISAAPIRDSIRIEAGETLTEEHFYKNRGLFKLLEKYGLSLIHCRALTDLREIPVDRAGETPVQFLVNGRAVTSLLTIEDRNPPELEAKEVVIAKGESVKKEDFVESLNDATQTKIKVKGLSAYQKTGKPGIYDIVVMARDDAGNRTKKKTKLYVLDVKRRVLAELGEKTLLPSAFLPKQSKNKTTLAFRQGFDVSPVLEYTGVYSLPFTATFHGEKKEVDLKLEVRDTKAPVFTGVKDFVLYMGEDISYRKGVSVEDNQKEEIDFKVDASGVNPKTPGKYPVYYKASDSAGNQTKKKVIVTVKSASANRKKQVKAEVKDLLREMIKKEMTDLQKLEEVFRFCNSISYTGHSPKEDLYEAAYEGLKTRTGDCFTYYAVAKVLLDELDFEEKMITRKEGKSRHFWNLVKYKKDWYHFDSCPIAFSDGFSPFMRSDKDMKAFSDWYGSRFPDRKNYYRFEEEKYPKRAEKSIKIK